MTIATKSTRKTSARKKAARPAPKAPRKASGQRPDGLRPGSKQALLIDSALAAGPSGTTEAELCKKIGWTKCATTLRRVAARVGAHVERKDHRFVVLLKKGSA